MPQIDPVILQLRADLRDYTAKVSQAERLSQQRLGNIERMGGRMSNSLTRSFQAAGRAALGMAAAYASVQTAREFLRIADAAKQVEAQLRLATRESGSFGQAQRDVRRIATETRTSLEATAQLYATFQRNAAELGVSQEQSARATETVTKAFRISGATAAEAAGGLRQFLQGIQSGTLRGEELNSVLENAPRLARLIADSLGVTIGQLRALGQEGNLAGDKLIRALTDRKFTDAIDAEFRELPVTFGEAMQQVENAAIITFGAFDRGGQFSTALANFVTDGTRGFADLERSALETGIDIRSTFEGLANVFEPLVQAARNAFGEIGSEAVTLADRIRPLLGQIDAITGGLGAADRVIANDPGIFGRANDWINRNVWGGTSGTNLLGRFNEAHAVADQQRRRDLNLTPLRAGLQALREAGAQNAAPPPRPTATGGGQTDAQRRAAARRAEAEARRAETERRRAIQDEASRNAEMARLDDDVLAARAALARAAEDVLAFELQQIDRARDARLAQYQTELKLGDITQQEYDLRAARVEEAARLQKQGALLEKAEDDVERAAELQREQLRMQQDMAALESDALLARADIADTLEQRRALEEEALRIQHEIERQMLEQAIAEGRIADAAKARALLSERQHYQAVDLGKRNQGAFGRYLDSTADPRAAAEYAAVRELEDLRDGLAEGVTSQLGIKNQFVRDMVSLFIEQNLIRPVIEGLRNNGGGLGGVIGAVGSIFGGGRGPTNLLPGFATGGSMLIGGRAGTDNNLLSLNGQPIARVSRGETLNISPNQRLAQAGPQGGGVSVVRLELSGDIDARIQTQAAGVAVQVVRASANDLTEMAATETISRLTRPTM